MNHTNSLQRMIKLDKGRIKVSLVYFWIWKYLTLRLPYQKRTFIIKRSYKFCDSSGRPLSVSCLFTGNLLRGHPSKRPPSFVSTHPLSAIGNSVQTTCVPAKRPLYRRLMATSKQALAHSFLLIKDSVDRMSE